MAFLGEKMDLRRKKKPNEQGERRIRSKMSRNRKRDSWPENWEKKTIKERQKGHSISYSRGADLCPRKASSSFGFFFPCNDAPAVVKISENPIAEKPLDENRQLRSNIQQIMICRTLKAEIPPMDFMSLKSMANKLEIIWKRFQWEAIMETKIDLIGRWLRSKSEKV